MPQIMLVYEEEPVNYQVFLTEFKEIFHLIQVKKDNFSEGNCFFYSSDLCLIEFCSLRLNENFLVQSVKDYEKS